jgi:Tol biopolymer transport system component
LVAVIDRSGRREALTEAFSGVTGGLAWSPDETDIWFTAGRKGSVRALYAVSLSGHLRTILESAGQIVLDDVLPDGRALLHQVPGGHDPGRQLLRLFL